MDLHSDPRIKVIRCLEFLETFPFAPIFVVHLQSLQCDFVPEKFQMCFGGCLHRASNKKSCECFLKIPIIHGLALDHNVFLQRKSVKIECNNLWLAPSMRQKCGASKQFCKNLSCISAKSELFLFFVPQNNVFAVTL